MTKVLVQVREGMTYMADHGPMGREDGVFEVSLEDYKLAFPVLVACHTVDYLVGKNRMMSRAEARA